MTALALRSDQEFWDDKQLAALRQLGVENAGNGDLAVFLHQAQKTGLDPFSRQLYMIGRWSKSGTKWTIQASIDGLRIVAQRSGEYAGQVGPLWCGPDGEWRDVWLADEPPAAAKVGVLRTGFVEPVWGVARWGAYAQTTKEGKPTAMWARMGDVMLAKCAEALALRKAFPHDLSGIYTDDEMAQADRKGDYKADPQNNHGALVAEVLTDDKGKRAERGAPAGDDPWASSEWAVGWRGDLAKAETQDQFDALWQTLTHAVGAGEVSEAEAAQLKGELAERAAQVLPGEVQDAEVVEPEQVAS